MGKLTPLGDPAPNAPKWFAAVEVIKLAGDREWLHRPQRRFQTTGGTSGNAVRRISFFRTLCDSKWPDEQESVEQILLVGH